MDLHHKWLPLKMLREVVSRHAKRCCSLLIVVVTRCASSTVVASTAATASAITATSTSATAAVAKEAFLPSLMPASQVVAPALAAVAPMGMNVPLASATFAWSWWLAIDRVSGCAMSLECARCFLSRRTLGTFLLIGFLLGVTHVEHGWCLRGYNPGTLVLVEEMNRLSKQSTEVSSWIIAFVGANIEDKIVVLDSLELPFKGFRTI
jgi:hypothetical protein